MSKTGSAYDLRLLPRLNKSKIDVLSLTRGKISFDRACGNKHKRPKNTLSQEDLQAALQRSTNTTQAPVGMLRSRRTKSAVGSGWTGDAGCSTERTKHRCALAKSACVQLLAWQCMICTSAAVFYTSESATQNVLFLFHVYGYLGVKPPRVLVCDTSVSLSPLPSSSPAFHLLSR